MVSVDRELSLLHLFGVIQSRWKIILAAGILAGVLNATVFFFIPPLYEASSTILVSRTRSKEESFGIDRTAVEADSYALALQSGEVLEKLQRQFHLDQPPYSFNIEQLRDAVAIWALRRENSLQVRVQLRDRSRNTPSLVSGMANFFLEEADRIATELLKQDMDKSRQIYDEEYERAKRELEEVRSQYQAVRLQSRVEEMKELIKSLGGGQTKLLEALALAQSDFLQKGSQFEKLETYLADEKPVRTLNRALEETPSVLNIYAARTGKAATELYSATASTQVLNEVYTKLRELRDTAAAGYSGAGEALKHLPEDLKDYSERSRAAELILNASEEAVKFWEDRLKTAQASFMEVSKRRALAVMAIASDRQDLISWVRAYPPLKPAGLPRSLLCVAAMLLGMTLLAVLILLLEMIKTTTRVV
jgi:capsular polysaccharide biosynthesis protein